MEEEENLRTNDDDNNKQRNCIEKKRNKRVHQCNYYSFRVIDEHIFELVYLYTDIQTNEKKIYIHKYKCESTFESNFQR